MFWYKEETKTINNIIFKRIKYKLTENGLKELNELLEEQKIMKDVFCKFPELQYSFGAGTEVYVKGNKFYNTYSLYIEKKEISEISKNSFYLSTKEKETRWEEIKNEKREKEFIKSRKEAFENFKVYGAPTIMALLTVHKLKKRGAF